MIEIALNLLSIFSVVVIIYGLFSHNISKYLSVLVDVLIFICTFAIVCSVFLPVNTRTPEKLSIEITAPVILLSISLLFVYWIYAKKSFPEISVKGVALLGLSGALFRLISY